mmetsp:Transcript_27139/g.78309  ORF Transcript_27139/g.78309 Transcript_27139/m.78309 type:complete len:667 (+) Transcript_27139:227-2227(+)
MFGPAKGNLTLSSQKMDLEERFGCVILPRAQRAKSQGKHWFYASIKIFSSDRNKVQDAMEGMKKILENAGRNRGNQSSMLNWTPPEFVISSPKSGDAKGKKRQMIGATDESEKLEFAEGADSNVAAGATKKPRLSTETATNTNVPNTWLLATYVAVGEKLANSAQFPPGSQVMTAHGNIVVTGTVFSVYMKLTQPKLSPGSSYDVCYTVDTHSGISSSGKITPISEKDLQFASGCPVFISPSLVPVAQCASNEADGWIAATVMSSFQCTGEANESYLVSLLDGAGKVNGVPRDLLRYRKMSQPPSQSKSKPKETSKAREDESTASALGSISSSFVGSTATSESSATVTWRLDIPSEIGFDAVREHLHGEDGAVASKMSQKLGINIFVMGPDLVRPADLMLGQHLQDLLSADTPNDSRSPCILLIGPSDRLAKATKVIEHILVQKAYSGDDKEAMKRMLRFVAAISSNIVDGQTCPAASMKAKETDTVRPPACQEDRRGFPNAASEAAAHIQERSVPESFAEVAAEILKIVSQMGPVLIGTVNIEFRKRHGKPIDCQRLGFDKLKELILNIPSVYLKSEQRQNGHVDIYVMSRVRMVSEKVLRLVRERGHVPLSQLKAFYKERYNKILDHERIGFPKVTLLVDAIPNLTIKVIGTNNRVIFYSEVDS